MATDANDRSWTQSYVYGAGNERISMSYVPSTDPSNDWDPTSGTGSNTSSIPMKTLYYLENSLGSVIGLQAQDGSISARYHYDEFGIVEDAEKFDLNYPGPDNLFGYTGLGYDFNSGLLYARARYLDSSIGRFISEDTYEGDTKNPLSLNLYTYVYNNPTRYHDPSGNVPVLVALIGKQVLNYGLDVMIGVGTDYLEHLNMKSEGEVTRCQGMREAKRGAGIPASQTHSTHKQVRDKQYEDRIVYEFDVNRGSSNKGENM